MLTRYESLYPNQIHQLSISASKHFYAGKDGLLKYQKKPFDIKLSNIQKSDKDHLLIYSLRDHFSGLYYIELAFASNPISARDFLGRAWRGTELVVLLGIPYFLMIPKTVEDAFPGISNLMQQQGIELIPVTSGFQSGGLIAAKAVEGHLIFANDRPLDKIHEVAINVCRYNSKDSVRGLRLNKENVWIENVGEIDFPADDF